MTTLRSKNPTRTASEAPPTNESAERIVVAARGHFFAHGFRSVTMDDLAGELGMSKKTLYTQFSSKAELLRAVLLAKFRSVETDLEAIVAGAANDASAALHQLLACMQRHTEEIQPPFVRDIRRETPELFQLVEERRRDLIQRYFGRIFDQGRRAGIIRKDISSELIVEILLGAVQAVMNPAKIEHLGLEPKTGYGAIVSVILDGVMTEKGRSKSADWGGRSRS
jgi:AcrR family transcriptional regulator